MLDSDPVLLLLVLFFTKASFALNLVSRSTGALTLFDSLLKEKSGLLLLLLLLGLLLLMGVVATPSLFVVSWPWHLLLPNIRGRNLMVKIVAAAAAAAAAGY
jgi:hypothetical protein